MSTPHDLKSLGMPRPEPELSPAARAICRGAIAIAILGLAYGAVLDVTDRMVIVMTPAALEATIQAERIKAAREAFDAAREDGECFLNWRANPKPRKGAM